MPTNDVKTYTLLGTDGRPYQSLTPGTLGGHRGNKIYGRLDCPSALRWIARGKYVKQRVFFADEVTAIAAGYRPCAVCLPEKYARWKSGQHPASVSPIDE
ncbi:metal-binding protein [bacterium]|nr:MAG: metal-binding protein [bacterium]